MKVSNPSELKGKFVNFIIDYVINLFKDKSYCKFKSINMYGIMPSQKGNVTPDEVEAIASSIYLISTTKKELG